MPEGGIGQATGQVCLGHLISNLRDPGTVINRESGPQEYPSGMRVCSTSAGPFEWATSETTRSALGATARISEASGITLRAAAGNDSLQAYMHLTTETTRWKFDAVNTHIIGLTSAYLNASLSGSDVMRYIGEHKLKFMCSFFMVTGIKVGVGGVIETKTTKTKGVGTKADPQITAPGLPMASINMQAAKEKTASNTVTQHLPEEVIWAYRLAKISRGLLDPDWTFSTVQKGTTLDIEQEQLTEEGIAELLVKEGFCNFRVALEETSDGKAGDFYIVMGEPH
ncbi:hypothetical protein MCOR01_003704 [Pyricularia oryzae]|nr:hypothetical protein MCOR01_003704 [Pyricularia oryzae]